MLVTLITALLRRAFPGTPKWVLRVMALSLPKFVDLSEEVSGYKDHEMRLAAALDGVESILDSSFDDVPHWADLDEDERDDILQAAADVILIVSRLVRRRSDG